MNTSSVHISAIVFDLDGTLYSSEEFAETIQKVAQEYISEILTVSMEEAASQMDSTRIRMQQKLGTVQTLSNICIELGGSVRGLHRFFTEKLSPETYLKRDGRVISLFHKLCKQYDLILYTNNNRALTMRILAILGLDIFFNRIYAIDDSWVAKPDDATFHQLVIATGLKPEQILFVGDRYDIDLRLPESNGCPVYFTENVEQLLKLESLLAL